MYTCTNVESLNPPNSLFCRFTPVIALSRLTEQIHTRVICQNTISIVRLGNDRFRLSLNVLVLAHTICHTPLGLIYVCTIKTVNLKVRYSWQNEFRTMSLVRVATLRGHIGPVWSVAWSPRGLLASAGADRSVRVWARGEGGEWTVVTSTASSTFLRAVRDVSWSPDCRSLATASFDASATILELTNDGKPKLDPVVCLEGHDSEVKSVAYSSAGGLLATCSRDRSVWIWEVGLDFDYECVAVLSSHRGDVKKVVWHPHIEMLVSCSFDDSIRVWVEDADDWFCSEELVAHSSTVWDACFDDSGNLLFSVSADSCLIIWNREAPDPSVIGAASRFVVIGRIDRLTSEPLYSVSWSKKRRVLAIGSGDDSIHLVRQTSARSEMPTALTETWQVFYTEKRAHSGDVNCVAWSVHDQHLLASSGDDGLVRIWELNTEPSLI